MSKFIRSIFQIRSIKLNGVSAEDGDRPKHHAESNGRITQEVLLHSERIAPIAAFHIYRINPTTIVKTGDGVRMTEAASMRFVGENTSIPVPKVFDAFIEESKHVCIVLGYIDRRPLDEV